MREILFRGKRTDTKAWKFGFYVVQSDKREYIVDSEGWNHKIDPETVGQFTGLTDKNGKKIFEGDIVEIIHEGIYECRWDEGNFEFGFANGTESFGIAYISPYDIVVIGNIHDDADLLEVDDD